MAKGWIYCHPHTTMPGLYAHFLIDPIDSMLRDRNSIVFAVFCSEARYAVYLGLMLLAFLAILIWEGNTARISIPRECKL